MERTERPTDPIWFPEEGPARTYAATETLLKESTLYVVHDSILETGPDLKLRETDRYFVQAEPAYDPFAGERLVATYTNGEEA